jgi:DNA-binding transcriptional regulator LsrR (DeoR family)
VARRYDEHVIDSRERRRLAYEAALMYYMDDQKMESIAKRMNMSRSTVSRLIAIAREEGLVRISLRPPEEPIDTTASRLRAIYGINVIVVPVPTATAEVRRLERVATVAGRLISEAVSDNAVIGIAWGTTLSAVSERLVPRPLTGVKVVQLNGAANPATSGILYVGELLGNFGRAFQAEVINFPVPAFFDYADTREALWRERSISSVRELGRNADIAIFGVGAFATPVASHVYSRDYLSDDEVAQLQSDGVVGDICTVFIRSDGSYADIELNSRATGPTPDELRKIPQRICVVAGSAKAQALLGALRTGAVTDLIVDDECAQIVLQASERAAGNSGE